MLRLMRLFCLPAIILAFGPLAAAEYHNWKAVNGTYDGVWSDVAHWSRKRLPDSNESIYIDNITCTITLDGDYSANLFQLLEGTKTVTLAGDGSLTETGGTYPHIHKGRTLLLTGTVFYNASSPNEYHSMSATLRLAGGGMRTRLYQPGNVTDICGGAFTNSTATYLSGQLCRLSAGNYHATDKLTFAGGSCLSVTGGALSAKNGIAFQRDATFALTNATLDLGRATFANGAKIRLGENAVLKLAHTSSVATTDIIADPTAKIVFCVADGAAAARSCPILLPVGESLENYGLTILVEGPDNWRGQAIGPCFFLTGGVATTPSTAYEWTGAVDGFWSTPGNWHGGNVPPAGAYVYISGETHTVITNDLPDHSIKGILVREGTAPVLIRGNPLKLTSTTASWSGQIAFRSDAKFPVVVETLVDMNSKYGYTQTRNSRIELRNAIRQSDSHSKRYVRYHGSTILGGTATFRRLLGRASESCSLTFLPSADYTLTDQCDGPDADHSTNASLSYGGAFTLMAGARLTVSGPWCQVSRASSKIDGLLDFKGTLRGTQHFYGSGTVKTSGKFHTAIPATNVVHIGGTLTLQPAGWNTQPGEANIVRLCATNGTPTLAAAADWTYGPAEGEALAARALHIASQATLTIDTENPETGEGQTVTFTDPIVADGSLVKAGRGTLVLPAAGSTFKANLTLAGGTLHLNAPLSVDGDFVVDGDGRLTFDRALLEPQRTLTLLTAAAIPVLPAVHPAYAVRRATDPASGRVSLRLFRRSTTLLIY